VFSLTKQYREIVIVCGLILFFIGRTGRERGGAMKTWMIMTVFLLTAVFPTYAAEQSKLVFRGLDMELLQTVDTMTDEKGCALSIGPPSWKFVLTSDKGFFITKTVGQFAPDEQHLIRVGTQKALPLVAVPRRNVLTLADPSLAPSVVKAVVAGEDVKIRFFTFPDRKMVDVAVENPNVGYGYKRAMAGCGWRDIGPRGELAPAKLSVYEATKPESAGYASASVVGNSQLTLNKGPDQYGGGCHIGVGVVKLFGLKMGQWVNENVDLNGRTSLVIRDSGGRVLFSSKVPSGYGASVRLEKGAFVPQPGNPWPAGEAAAKAAWRAGPLGTIQLDPPDIWNTQAMLYGFRELWTWGIQRCGFPAIQ